MAAHGKAHAENGALAEAMQPFGPLPMGCGPLHKQL